MVEKVGVKVLTTQVSITSGGLDGEDATLDVEERYIESTTAQIVDKDVALLVGLVGTKTVGNSSSGGLVDDTQDVEARDGTGVLGGLTLVVVEIGRDCDDCLLNLLAELDLSNLLHLFATYLSVLVQLIGVCSFFRLSYLVQDHSGDLLGGELLGLAEVLDLDLGASVVVHDLEGPGLHILLDGRVIEAATDQSPVNVVLDAGVPELCDRN